MTHKQICTAINETVMECIEGPLDPEEIWGLRLMLLVLAVVAILYIRWEIRNYRRDKLR